MEDTAKSGAMKEINEESGSNSGPTINMPPALGWVLSCEYAYDSVVRK